MLEKETVVYYSSDRKVVSNKEFFKSDYVWSEEQKQNIPLVLKGSSPRLSGPEESLSLKRKSACACVQAVYIS